MLPPDEGPTSTERLTGGPLAWIGSELDRSGVKRPGYAKMLLLGFLIGRLPTLQDEEAVRSTTRMLFPPKRRKMVE